jgi:hypothetical protein
MESAGIDIRAFVEKVVTGVERVQDNERLACNIEIYDIGT